MDDKKTTKSGVKEGYERYTLITKSEIIEDLKSIAYWDRKTITELSTSALSEFIGNWKKAHPDVPLRGKQ